MSIPTLKHNKLSKGKLDYSIPYIRDYPDSKNVSKSEKMGFTFNRKPEKLVT